MEPFLPVKQTAEYRQRLLAALEKLVDLQAAHNQILRDLRNLLDTAFCIVLVAVVGVLFFGSCH